MPNPTFLDRLNEFDPNKDNGVMYATYAPGRRPAWKMHSSRQLMLTTMHGWRYIAFYEHKNGEWKLLARKAREHHNQTCSWCGGTTLVYDHARTAWDSLPVADGVWDIGVFVWRKGQSKVVDPPVLDYLCQACYRA